MIHAGRLLLGALFTFGLSACSEPKKPELAIVKTVKAYNVGGASNSQKRAFPGKVVASKTAELSFQVSGNLVKLPVLEGDTVKKGQLLAALEPDRYQEKVNEAKAKYELAKAHYKRGKTLVKDKFISEAEYDKLKSNLSVHQAGLSTAQKNLTDTVLNAPFDGIVAKKYVDNHEDIKAKEPIMAVHDIEHVDIEIQVPEYIILRIDKEDSYDSRIFFEGLIDRSYPVTVKEFSSKADPDTQTYQVVYTMSAPKGINVLPGMSVTIQVDLPDFKSGAKSYYLIPSSAVFNNEKNQTLVWLIDAKTGKIKAKKVSVANLSQGEVKVLSGLSKGDTIVAAGVHFLRAGDIVKPIEEAK